jgi:phosphatidylethanolamine/phosphatidyl-N-methylethanolamine N-methyltransferase
MSVSSIRKVYNSYASFYDYLFGPVFNPGRHLCTEIINKNAAPNASVLELGIGTGLSLPFYRSDLQITGIDISEKMLKKAEKRVVDNQLETKVQLKIMDAGHLEFADKSFDFIVAMYVASVVPDINAFLQEITRVCKPRGEIIFVNHFASEKSLVYFLEKKIARAQKILGFKSDFSIDSILNHRQFELLESRKINLFGYWKLLHCRRRVE